MPATLVETEQRVLLHNTSWDTYERLLAENIDRLSTRFAFDDGELEIMTVSYEQERHNRTLADIVEIVAEETGKDFVPAGSTTFRLRELLKGCEPDSCFYIERAAQMRGKRELEFPGDPPPDLVIEIDISRNSLNRFPIYAGLGIPEVWRYDGKRVIMHALRGAAYVETALSAALGPLTSHQATVFMEESFKKDRRTWRRQICERVRNPLQG